MAFLAIVSAGLGMLGSIQQAKGIKAEAEANANAAEYNAKVSEINRRAEMDKGATEHDDYERKMDRERAKSIAARGASGVTLAGTPLLVDEDVVNEIALGAARSGYDSSVKATAYGNQANLDRASAKNFRSAGRTAAGATLLSGAARSFGGLSGQTKTAQYQYG
jgi:hypothetical protein